VRFFSRLYLALRPHARANSRTNSRTRVFVLSAAVLGVMALSGLLTVNLVIREDVTSLMPTRPPGLAEQFRILREAPFAQSLFIALGGGDPAGSAKKVAEALRGPDMPFVLSGMDSFSPSLLPKLCAALPGLMDAGDMAALPPLLTEKAVAEALDKNRTLLLSARGLALRDFLAMDPLGLCARKLRGFASTTGTPKPARGRMQSVDGRYAVLVAEPAASMTDTAAARKVMTMARDAVGRGAPDAETIIIGGHRHTEENADVIQEDLRRILPASVLLIVLAYLVFVRTWRGLSIVLLPTASLLLASAFTGLVFDGISGIVIGFGSVILGITADYAIHVYFAMNGAESPEQSLERVSTPVLFGALTTLAAFAAFFSSSIPCIVQMTCFSIFGIVAALFLALVVLPQYLCSARTASAPPPFAEKWSAPEEATRLRPRTAVLTLLWAVLAAGLGGLLHSAPIDGDIRSLSYQSEAMEEDEARMRAIWGEQREQALFAVEETSRQAALEKNDRLWERFVTLSADNGYDLSSLTSLARFLPARSTQTARHAEWKAFWEERGPRTVAALRDLAPKAGFSVEAFAPFALWLSGEPPLVDAEVLTTLGLEFPLLLLRATPDGTHFVYGVAHEGRMPESFRDAIRDEGGHYVSGETFRAAMDEATRADMLRFGGLSLLAVLGTSVWLLRSLPRLALMLLPVSLGLFGVLAVYRLMGMSLNIFHAIALPLVMTLSVDYGIFMLAFLEGRLRRESVKGVLLSGLTTLSGFGALLLARHPALFSLGLTVSIGLSAALLAALVLMPRLVRPAHGPPLTPRVREAGHV
jgi:predicted exporter